jgi:hypothetical protein
MTTMKAVRIHSYGGIEVLAYEEVPRARKRKRSFRLWSGHKVFKWRVQWMISSV